jgi:uncharacterized Zn ribbon protein
MTERIFWDCDGNELNAGDEVIYVDSVGNDISLRRGTLLRITDSGNLQIEYQDKNCTITATRPVKMVMKARI